MNTVRENIIQNILTRLKAMSVVTGYSADYPLVDEWRLKPLEPADLPAIVISDDTNNVTNIMTDVCFNYSLALTISIVVDSDTAPTKLRNYIADVYKCVSTDLSCGGYAEDIVPVRDEVIFEQKDNVLGTIRVTFAVLYATAGWDLTAQI